jgi:hypothetical protein
MMAGTSLLTCPGGSSTSSAPCQSPAHNPLPGDVRWYYRHERSAASSGLAAARRPRHLPASPGDRLPGWRGTRPSKHSAAISRATAADPRRAITKPFWTPRKRGMDNAPANVVELLVSRSCMCSYRHSQGSEYWSRQLARIRPPRRRSLQTGDHHRYRAQHEALAASEFHLDLRLNTPRGL